MEKELLKKFVAEAVQITEGDKWKLTNVALTLKFSESCEFVKILKEQHGIVIYYGNVF